MAVVNEVITKFSFQGSTQPLDGFNSGMKESVDMMAKYAAGILAVGTTLNGLLTEQLGAQDEMIHLSKSTGVAIEKIQTLDYIASQTGSSVGSMESTIASLSEKIGEASLKGSEDFSQLGISVRGSNGEVKKADQVLMEVKNRFNQLGYSMSEKRSMASSLGIDSSLIEMMNLTGGEFDKLAKKATRFGQLTGEQSKTVMEFNSTISDLKGGMDSMATQIAVSVAPGFNDFMTDMGDMLAENKDVIIEFFTKASEMFSRLMPLILGVAGAFAIMNASILVIPAIVIGIILLIDDLIVAFQGGESVIANLFDNILGLGEGATAGFLHGFIDPVIESIKDLYEVFKTTFKLIGAVFTLDGDAILTELDNLGKALLNFFKPTADLITDLIIAPFKEMMSGISSLGSVFGFGDSGDSEKSLDQSGKLQSNINNSTQNNSSNQSQSINQDVTVQINSNNPQEAGTAVVDALNEELKVAKTNSGRGGR
jgi:hypothetical protein